MPKNSPLESENFHPFGDLLGLNFTEVEDGYSRCVLQVRDELKNPHGTLHGGVLYSMADTGMGAALYTKMDENETCSCVEVNVRYFKLLITDREIPQVAATGNLTPTRGRPTGVVFWQPPPNVSPTMEPEILVDRNCEVGEGPIWHAAEQRLYWVDIVDGRLYRYDPADGSDELLHEQDVIGGVTVQADGSLLLFGAKGSIRRWADGDVETIVESVEGEADSRFNDVIADPEGRVYGGTMPTDDRLGRLYRVDVDGSVTRVAEGFDIPNGMGFTPDLDQLYVTDSNAGEIRAYDYDRETGALSGPDVVVDTGGEAGIPDGMTVDKEGYIWSARWNGGCLVRYAPDGSEVDRVEFPARKVSSVSFGGPDLSTAFVTTANREGRESEGEGAGALFGLQLGVGGREEFVSRVAAE